MVRKGFICLAVLLTLSACSPSVRTYDAVVTSAVPEVIEPGDIEPVYEQSGSGWLGDNYIELRDAVLVDDFNGVPAIIVNISWTNDSSDVKSAASIMDFSAYQGDEKLKAATVTGVSWYNAGLVYEEIDPGVTADIHVAFELSGSSNVAVTVREFSSEAGESVKMTYQLDELVVIE